MQEFSKDVVIANCASFSDDTMAESELFGHKKGAFTGAEKDKIGLFKEADGKSLFLDEVHALSLRVQQKMMTALQTEGKGENKGKFRIRRLGDVQSDYVTVRPVFASNRTLSELKKVLFPDFYDRISQLVVEMPSLHKRKADLKSEFEKVWDEMQFKEYPTCPDLKDFHKWLKRIPLEGNYRSLHSIAINWHQGRLMMGEKKEEEIFDFVRKQISTYHVGWASPKDKALYNFRKGATKKELEREYQKALYDWAVSKDGYGGPGEAQKGLKHARLANPHKK